MACHVIDGDGAVVSAQEFAAVLSSTLGSKYSVVGVLGGQSTGKSTWLNGVFGTSFAVMNADGARTSTTRGIWMASSLQWPHLLAMDVEGTDGQERFDDQTFERRTSLFALAVCDVLAINMWTWEVGRFHAANLSLLRTVFELRLQLFPFTAQKTKLLFILRDHVRGALEHHVDVIKKSLSKVWEGVYHADSESAETVEDVFDLLFFSLPHFQLQHAEFEAKLLDARLCFTPGAPECILSSDNAGARENVPFEGFHSYMKNVWETVCANKDLDLPSQKELLAEHRCMEISEAILANVREQVDKWSHTIIKEKEAVKNLGDTVTKLAFVAAEELKEKAKLYSGHTVTTQSGLLHTKVLNLCEGVLQKQVDLVTDACAEKFTQEMNTSITSITRR